ncbi:hypothetical protein BC832DRAFT_559277 [Gaertneriomyces semiglobifer]|nr:hypothetical protein BC832DRAFT_559277 [Gaertneriomyces semiglobifer]
MRDHCASFSTSATSTTTTTMMDEPRQSVAVPTLEIPIPVRPLPGLSPMLSPLPSPPTQSPLDRTPHPYHIAFEPSRRRRENPRDTMEDDHVEKSTASPPSPSSPTSPSSHSKTESFSPKEESGSQPRSHSQSTHRAGSAEPISPPRPNTLRTRISSNIIVRSILLLVRGVLVVLLMITWLLLTLYLFWLSYVISVTMSIIRRCPAIFAAAFEAGRRSLFVAVGLGKVALRAGQGVWSAGRQAYREAGRVWGEYATPWTRLLWVGNSSYEMRPSQTTRHAAPKSSDEPAASDTSTFTPSSISSQEASTSTYPVSDYPPDESHFSSGSASSDTHHDSYYVYPSPQASPRHSPFGDLDENTDDLKRSSNRNSRWSRSSQSSGSSIWSFDSGYAEERRSSL